MRKNVASQNIAVQMNSRTDGSPLTSSVSVFVTIDNGTQTAGGGTLTHKGNGHWNYAPTQAETNGNHVAFTFTHATGVNQTVNVYPVAFDPYDSVRLGLTALPNAAAEAAGGLYTRGTGAGQINQPANGMIDANVVRNAGTAIVAAAGRQEVNVSHFGGTAGTFAAGRPEVNTTHAAGTAWNSGAIGPATLAADTIQAAKIQTGAITNTKFAAGAIDAAAIATDAITAAKIAANAITAAKIATDAIGAAQLAADAVAEIQAGLATAAALATVQADTDDIQTRLPAALIAGRMDSNAQVVADKTGYTLSAAGVDDIWDENIVAAHGTADTAGLLLRALGALISQRANNPTLHALLNIPDSADANLNQLAGRVWEEVLTGATHNTNNSAGKRLRQLQAGSTAFSGTINGVPSSTVIPLDAGASATTDFYKPGLIVIESSFGVQFRRIASYDGTLKEVTVATAFTTTPVNGDTVTIIPWATVRVSEMDTAVIDAGVIAPAAANKIADHVLRRTYANARVSADGDAVAFRSLLGAVGKMVNKWAISGGVLTVYQEDDVTATAPGGTQNVTGTAGADPITTLDTN